MTPTVNDRAQVTSVATGPNRDVLAVEDLTIRLPVGGRVTEIVSDVSLHVGRREILGLVGESGSGKTMTALSIMRLLPPNAAVEGRVVFEGQDLLKLGERSLRGIRGKGIGMIFQEPRRSLHPAFTVGEQIAEVVRRHEQTGRDTAWKRAVEMLDLVRIPGASERAHDYPHMLSGGMCQRVMLAVALVTRPKLLIADEPTTSLDVTVQARVLSLVRDLQEELGLGVLFITHDLGVIAQMCDRIEVMYAGEIVEEATAEETYVSPLHPYTEGLLEAIPDPEARRSLGFISGAVPPPGSWPSGCRFQPRCSFAESGCALVHPDLDPTMSDHRARCIRKSEITLRGIDR